MPCLDWMRGFRRVLMTDAEVIFDSRYFGKKEVTIWSRRPQVSPSTRGRTPSILLRGWFALQDTSIDGSRGRKVTLGV